MDTLIKNMHTWIDLFLGYLLRRAASARKFFLPFSCVSRKKAVPLQPQRLETRKNEKSNVQFYPPQYG